jgi:hypothetical protein
MLEFESGLLWKRVFELLIFLFAAYIVTSVFASRGFVCYIRVMGLLLFDGLSAPRLLTVFLFPNL